MNIDIDIGINVDVDIDMAVDSKKLQHGPGTIYAGVPFSLGVESYSKFQGFY